MAMLMNAGRHPSRLFMVPINVGEQRPTVEQATVVKKIVCVLFQVGSPLVFVPLELDHRIIPTIVVADKY